MLAVRRLEYDQARRGQQQSDLVCQLPAQHPVDPRSHKQDLGRAGVRPPSKVLKRTGGDAANILVPTQPRANCFTKESRIA
jgi:hypothetical protein